MFYIDIYRVVISTNCIFAHITHLCCKKDQGCFADLFFRLRVFQFSNIKLILTNNQWADYEKNLIT